MTTIIVSTQDEMTALGRKLARGLTRGDCVALRGDLGVGKSVLARAMIREVAGEPIDVPSPTFPLIEAYPFEPPLHHVDLYRLDGPEQVIELGLEDLIDHGVTLIEWPDRAEGILPHNRLDVTITERTNGERMVELMPRGEGWSRRIEALLSGGIV
ncbi:tRNA (adenosine(37)-N6)-threonylcarbamoyltransferase complex ATPase subunit type 1 TsaE [Parvularcula lutaonensis]|uniref:tRNA threonylcarbamoyladenosine biosynthesis protein TsaE n=1 Tax=Parvularcula lutaonensis TaxID=491923 RepID=A0ABV7MC48_9PROT|nr:tRNA (adenosine(37)-N6)-threonylcarbamoyltransferase complex ATPase subunit type 1 TsaE [Parvularcula lutaonensis]GGY37304.1 hypothetical protein GCM10007148_01900 [Parvularcula lutaonensis]